MKIFSANLRGVTTASVVNVTENLSTQTISISSVTGSFTVNGSGSADPYFFLIQNEEENLFEVTTQGVIVSVTQSVTPDPVQAGMYFDNAGNFFVGL